MNPSKTQKERVCFLARHLLRVYQLKTRDLVLEEGGVLLIFFVFISELN